MVKFLPLIFGAFFFIESNQYESRYDASYIYSKIFQQPKVAKNDLTINLKNIQRSHDGKNNNIKHPLWGSTHIPLMRYDEDKTSYMDNKEQPINYLKSARQISNIIGEYDQRIPIRNKNRLSMIFTFFGQFLDHDLTFTPGQEKSKGEHMDIPISKNDVKMNSEKKQSAKMEFIRSKFEMYKSRMQFNDITAYLDGSQVYGSSKQVADNLRTFSKGLLKTSSENNLPQQSNGFFFAGDVRVNENIALIAMHTVFMRQHNRVAKLCYQKNKSLSDQQIYQISRNYVIGLLQHITFDYFLPNLIGEELFARYIGEYKGYDQNSNPNIANQFATAAFRIGHPLLAELYPMLDKNYQPIQEFHLTQMFMRPDYYKDQSSIDNIFRGIVSIYAKQKSCSIVDSIRNLLILDHQHREIKLDLFSLNLQRSRDHGLPLYNNYRKIMGFSKYTSFLQVNYQYKLQKLFKDAYENVNNMQLWTGIICQQSVFGAVMGEFGSYLVAQQFKRIRNGDRFWYQYAYPSEVVADIKATTLGDIIQRNTGVKLVKNDVFHV